MAVIEREQRHYETVKEHFLLHAKQPKPLDMRLGNVAHKFDTYEYASSLNMSSKASHLSGGKPFKCMDLVQCYEPLTFASVIT